MKDHAKKLTITFAYNGETHVDEVPPDQRIEGVWHKVLAHFGIRPEDAAALGLFKDGSELSRDQSFEQAGVADGATLHIRPRQQRAG